MIIVMLRRPRKDDPRRDPYFEFGSFGLTGCHRKNLLADDAVSGHRLAFAQGGPSGFRLVMLTPVVDVRAFTDRHEAFWSPGEMPLKYEQAPLLIGKGGTTDVPELLAMMEDVDRSTWEARFASAFRTRKKPVSTKIAMSITNAWSRATQGADARAEHYWEALPWRPSVIDDDRAESHEALREKATGSLARVKEQRRTDCKPTRC